MERDILDRAKQWTIRPFDKDTRDEIKRLINSNSACLTDRFYRDLNFGTGGIRGVMGLGTNRINKYTLGKSTQGLSNYLHKLMPNKKIKVAIAYDCRNNSEEFAKIVAEVFSANNIFVFLFEDLRPTPELSFALRYLGCDAGIVLTASHNPPQYNGYKVYWKDGGQIVPPQDKQIINHVNQVSFEQINFKENKKLITYIGKKIDDAFCQASLKNGSFEIKNREDLKIVFTPLHGTTTNLIKKVLNLAGYSQVHLVEAQQIPDGSFPTVESPNPEDPKALKMAIDLADKIDADIVIGTDPDGDRMGIAVKDSTGRMTLLDGNQTMSVIIDFLINQWKKNGRLTGNQFVGTTLVSTDLVGKIATSYGVETKVGLTGFKWIAKMIEDYPTLEFIAGGEESFGYMVGDFVRDKDAITSALLVCEIATNAKNNRSSFYDELLKLYVNHGFYKDRLVSITENGREGARKIDRIMRKLRANPAEKIGESKIVSVSDYLISKKKNLSAKSETVLEVPKSNLIVYHTEDGGKIAVRPSGTEPKIKFYFSLRADLKNAEHLPELDEKLTRKIELIIDDFYNTISNLKLND